MNNDINLAEIIGTNIFRRMRELDLINETELRNAQIRSDYKELRKLNSSPVCIQMLMDKYAVSDSALNNILFRKKKVLH